jgi:hypothetical protein
VSQGQQPILNVSSVLSAFWTLPCNPYAGGQSP